MNFATLFRAYDAVMAFRDAARRLKDPSAPSPAETSLSQTSAAQRLAGHVETRLATVVVAALKEAFDRDHARLELERAQLDEQRRRAEAALQLEIRRQAVDREIARLRLLAGTALVGWLASIAVLLLHPADAASRAALGIGWLLLLGALGAAFQAQSRTSADAIGGNTPLGSAALPLWLMLAGFAATAISLLL